MVLNVRCRSEAMRPRCTFYLLVFLPTLAWAAFPQDNGPTALRSAARALTVGELLGVAELAGQGDTEAQLLTGLSLQLVAERIRYDAEGRKGMLRLSAHWLR